jgi:hypothetical protein
MMAIYNVYVKPLDDNQVYNKRFDSPNMKDLANQVKNYFKFAFDLVRLEKVYIVESYRDIEFGTNFNKVV